MPRKEQSAETLFKQSIKLNKQILKEIANLKKLTIRNQIMSYVRTIIILTPIIIAILYLIPFVKDFLKIYQPLVEYFEQAKNLKNIFQ